MVHRRHFDRGHTLKHRDGIVASSARRTSTSLQLAATVWTTSSWSTTCARIAFTSLAARTRLTATVITTSAVAVAILAARMLVVLLELLHARCGELHGLATVHQHYKDRAEVTADTYADTLLSSLRGLLDLHKFTRAHLRQRQTLGLCNEKCLDVLERQITNPHKGRRPGGHDAHLVIKQNEPLAAELPLTGHVFTAVDVAVNTRCQSHLSAHLLCERLGFGAAEHADA
mmetsp:Transcript_84257/g.235130  ORF Transcript_84257/g.235130 Transcript_84257/m.235130 type:complete len:229 (-) Transcript_84257:287-973(-)